MLKRLYALTTWVIALSCIALAVLVSVARLFLPLVAEERAAIEARVSELVGQPIEIASVQAEIRGIIPRLYLEDVRLLDPSGEQVLLRADHLLIDIDPVQSLLDLSLRLRKVSVRGFDLEVIRTRDNRIVVRGVWERALDQPAPATGMSPWAGLQGLSFNIGDSRVHWVDEPGGHDLVFEQIALAVRLEQGRVRFSGSLNPPEELGRSLQLVADLRGNLAQAGGWSGVIYARGKDLRLPLLPASDVLAAQGLEQGRGSVTVWSHWRAGRVVRLAGDIGMRDMVFALDTDRGRESHRLDRVAARFLWEALDGGGWRTRAAGLQVVRDEREWPVGDLSVELRPRDDARFLRLSADTLRLEDLVPLARIGEHLAPALRERLARLALQGDLRDLRVDLEWRDQEVAWLRADGIFHDLGFQPLGEFRTPGLSGLDGEFALTRDEGEVTLATGQVALVYPTVLANPVEFQRVLATARWQREGGSWQVQTDRMQLQGEDLDVSGTLALKRQADTAPVIDLNLEFANGDVARASRYFPSIMRENLRTWLETALRGGRFEQGELVLSGPLDRFPFRDGSGRFETRFDVSDLSLRYREDWPELTEMRAAVRFNGPGMYIDVSGGRLFDTRLESGRVSIADFRRPLLEVRAKASGPLADGLRYMTESDIARRQVDAFALVKTSGPARLDLSLDIPLSRKLNRELELEGVVALDGVTVDVPSAAVTLRDLSGPLRFTRHTLEARDITGRFNDGAISLGATRQARGDILISGTGTFEAGAMLDPYAPTIARHLQGQSAWFVHLNLPVASGGPTELNIASGLEGVTVDLPAPLGKAEHEARSLNVRAELGSGSAPTFRVTYGNVLSSVFTVMRGPEGAHIGRAEVRFNEGDAVLPESGVRLAGRLASIDLEQWREAMAGPGAADEADETAAAPVWLSSIDLRIDHVDLFGRPLEDLRLSADREDDAWRILVNASPISGLIIVPHADNAAQPLELELEHLDLDMLQRDGEGGATDPRELPSLRVSSGVLVFRGQRYRDLRLETSRQATGQQIHVFQVGQRYGNLRAYGEWRARSLERQRTSLRFEIESRDVGSLTKGLGFNTGISGGKGQFDGDLGWRGAPWDFELARLKGKVHMRIDDGRLTQVDPGAGRFIGLLNLSSLPRRLSLDFSDVFKEGFAFDRIEGNLSFADEAMYTNDLRVDGPAAKVTFTGRTDIGARTYDQTIIVRPEVSATLPVAGALMGGAGVGAAVFVLQKILPGGGDAVASGEIRYRMTGSWDNPLVEKVSGPATETETETEGAEPYNPWDTGS